MKKSTISLIVFIGTLFCQSCSKMTDNGLIDGQWQLMEIQKEDIATGEPYRNIINKKDEQIYWRFQLDMLMIHSTYSLANGYTYDTSARFKNSDTQLEVVNTYINYHDRDSLVSDPTTSTFESVGISGCHEIFEKEQLTSKKMILKNEKKRLIFRKF